MNYTATYSPEDNKLRLYASTRLDTETYAKVKGAGFRWAPRQELFVAPMWTPEREDVLLELAGEVGDEDTSLVERQEARAERFEEYSEKRAADSKAASKAADAIGERFYGGQPILVGHHSEKRARKDQSRMHGLMTKSVKMWETSDYWSARAAGAVRLAKFKERPDVRARRIKGLESDERKFVKHLKSLEARLRFWSRDDITLAQAIAVANTADDGGITVRSGERHWSLWGALTDGKVTLEYAIARRRETLPPTIAHYRRWLAHTQNRLVYERAMLNESGGTETDRVKPEKGGAVMCLWAPRNGWAFIEKVNKVTLTVRHQWNSGGRVFPVKVELSKVRGVMSKAEVEAAFADGRAVKSEQGLGFFLGVPAVAPPAAPRDEVPAEIVAMKAALKGGPAPVIAVPQLFPTPKAIAEQMIEAAAIEPGMCVLEPSAGTGNLVKAIVDTVDTEVLAYEINQSLCAALESAFPSYKLQVRCRDFLEVDDFMGCYPRVVMNPPFENGADIKHIRHAMRFLKPGGRLVALCGAGGRQRAFADEVGAEWTDLPAGSFAAQGTNVSVAMVVVDV